MLGNYPEETLYSSSTISNEQVSLHYFLDATKNKQGFPHLHEHVWVKKLLLESMIHFEYALLQFFF